MLTTNNAEWFPIWLQVLTPLHQSDNNADNVHDEWTGRVQKVTNRVDKLGEKIEDTRTDNEAFKEAQEKFREDVNHFMMEMRREFRMDSDSVRGSVSATEQQILVERKKTKGLVTRLARKSMG